MDRYRFRFWLESEQRWFYFGFESFLVNKDAIEKALDDGVKIYQSTGMLDKNGVPIFEGDLIKLSSNDNISKEVIYAYGAFCAGMTEATCWDEEVEVDGNVKQRLLK